MYPIHCCLYGSIPSFKVSLLVVSMCLLSFFSCYQVITKAKQIVSCFHCAIGEEARRVFNDAQNMLNRVINEKLLTAVGQVGFYPANSEGDDIVIYSQNEDDSRSIIGNLYGLRQQVRVFYFIFCSSFTR